MTIPAQTWATDVLRKLNAPVVDETVQLLIAWAHGENTTARFNPLATTTKRPGSTDFNHNNGFPVQNFVTYEDGLSATVQTLRNGHYPTILGGLMAGDATRALSAPHEFDVWGTGGAHVARLFPSVVADWPDSGSWVPPSLKGGTVASPAVPVVSVPKKVDMFVVSSAKGAQYLVREYGQPIPISNPATSAALQSKGIPLVDARDDAFVTALTKYGA